MKRTEEVPEAAEGAPTLEPPATTILPEESSDGWVGPSVLARATYSGESIFVPPAGGWDEGAVETLSARDPAARFSRLQLLGRGGMGEVWRVLDTDLNRVVAMKILRGDRGLSRQLLARFVAEAQATAQLEHPGIVPVFELGRLDDGRLYYTMEEIRGRTLSEALRALHEASTPERWGADVGEERWGFLRVIDVLRQVCDAVGYAHARGVIHRDLKPGNVMLGEHGEVRVVDWGLVKILTPLPDPLQAAAGPELPPAQLGVDPATRIGHVAGTPGFMAPEQARGEVDRLTPAADVYALGGLLFCALVGAAPGHVEDPAATLDAFPRVPEALRALCLAALAEDPTQRPADASVLAEALRQWLDRARGEVEAQARVEAAEARFSSWSPVDRGAARAALLRLVDADERPTPRPADALEPRGLALLQGAGLVLLEGDQVRLADEGLIQRWSRLSGWVQSDRVGLRLRHQLLDAARGWVAAGEPEDALWRGEPLAEAELAERHGPEHLTDAERRFIQASVALERRRRRSRAVLSAGVVALLALITAVAVLGWRDADRARDAETAARELAEQRTLAARTSQFLAEGRSHAALATMRAALSTASPEEAPALRRQATELAASLGELEVLSVPGRALRAVAWTDGGARVRGLDEAGTLHTWRVRDGALLGSEDLGAAPVVSAWSADGARLAVLDAEGRLRLIREGAVQELEPLAPLRWLRFTPDGRHLLGLNEQGELRAWSAEDGAALGDMRAAKDRLGGPGWTHVSLAPEGGWLWTREHPAHFTLWALEPLRPLLEVDWPGQVWRFAATGTQAQLVLKEASRALLWDAATDAVLGSFASNHDAATGLSLSPDGRSLLAAHGDVAIYELATGALRQEVNEHDGDVLHLAYSADGRQLATAGTDGQVILWDAHTWRHVATQRDHVGAVASLHFSPDARQLLSLGADGRVRVWTPQTSLSTEHRRCRVDQYGTLTLGPSGRRALEGTNSAICLVDLEADRAVVLETGGFARALGWSPDGAVAYTVDLEGALRAFDAETGQLLAVTEHPGFAPIQVDAAGELLFIELTENPALLREEAGGLRRVWPRAFEQGDGATGSGRDWVQVRGPEGQRVMLDSRAGEAVFTAWDADIARLSHSEAARRVLVLGPEGGLRLQLAGVEAPAWTEAGPYSDALLAEGGGFLATLDAAGEGGLRRAEDGALVGRFSTEAPGSRLLAVGDEGRRVLLETPARGIELWDARAGTLSLRLARSGGGFGDLLLTPEGLLTDGSDGLRTWSSAPTPEGEVPARSNLRLCREGFALVAALPYPEGGSPWSEAGCP
ncbi:MAG: protein kinase [Alphaproteobacteria bacterium]|nr:protein kinase [Alphaproteobacteria bacterium]